MAAPSNGNGNYSIWNMVHVGVIVFQGVIVLAWGVLRDDNANLRLEVRANAAITSQEFLRKSESAEYRQRIDNEIDGLKRSLMRTHDTYLTKEAYLGRHETLIQDIMRLNGRLDEVRRDFGSTYTLNDKIKELQDSIRELQQTVHRVGQIPTAAKGGEKP